jgi:hypothetical protein
VHSTVGVTGAIYAMRPERWKPLPAGLILDDLWVPMRLVTDGGRVGFCEEAIAYDDRRFPPSQEYRRKVRTLTGNFQLIGWLPSVLVPWRNPIWLQFLCHKLLRLLTPYLLTLALVAGAFAAAGAALPREGGLSGATLALVVGAIGTVALLVATSNRAREAVVMAVAMQAAVVQATINGLRGRWDVWSR